MLILDLSLSGALVASTHAPDAGPYTLTFDLLHSRVTVLLEVVRWSEREDGVFLWGCRRSPITEPSAEPAGDPIQNAVEGFELARRVLSDQRHASDPPDDEDWLTRTYSDLVEQGILANAVRVSAASRQPGGHRATRVLEYSLVIGASALVVVGGGSWVGRQLNATFEALGTALALALSSR